MMDVKSTDGDEKGSDDDDDDDDSDDDDGLIDDEDKNVNVATDPIGDFKTRMSVSHTTYFQGDLPKHQMSMDDIALSPKSKTLTGAARYLGGFYKQFRSELNKKHANKKLM